MIMSRIRLRDDHPSLARLASIALSNSYGRHQVLWGLFEDARRFLYHEEAPQRGRVSTPSYYALSDVEPKGDPGIFTIETKPYEPVVSKNDKLSFALRANPIIKRKRENNRNSAKHDVVMDAQRGFLLGLLGDDVPVGKSSRLQRKELYRLANDTVEAQRTALERQVESWFTDDAADALLHRASGLPAEDALRMVTTYAGELAARHWLERKGERRGFRLVEPQRTLVTEAYTRHTFQKSRERGARPVSFSSIDFRGLLEVTDSDVFSKTLLDGIGSAKGFGCGLLLIKRAR